MDIAKSHPQAAYSGLIHGVLSRWTYLSRTCPNINTLLQPLEDTLRTPFIPTISSQDTPNDTMRDLFALPRRHRGLGLLNPSISSSDHFTSSLAVMSPLVDLIISQSDHIPSHVSSLESDIKASIHATHRQHAREQSTAV